MLVGAALAQGILLMSGILAARLLGPEDRGHLALLVLPPLILGSVGGLGLPQALAYRWARDPDGRAAVLRVVAPAYLAQCVLLTLATAGIYALFLTPGAPELARTAALLLPSTAAILSWQYAVAGAQGRQKFDLATAVLISAPALYVVLLLAAVAAGTTHLEAIALFWTVSYVGAGALGLVLAVRHLGPSTGANAPVSFRELFSFGIRAVPSLASPIQALRLDQAVVGILLGAASLGLYVAAFAVTNLPLILAAFMSLTISGKVAAEVDGVAAERALRRMILALAGASLALGAVVWVLAPMLIGELFGPEFLGATTAARILVLGVVAAALLRSIGDGLRALGDSTASAVGEISSWVVLVPALLILSVVAGLEGAAVAVAATYGTGLAVVLARWYRRGRSHGAAPLGHPRAPVGWARGRGAVAGEPLRAKPVIGDD